MDLQCRGKTFLVMACSQGLGKAVAQALSDDGGRVLGTSRKPGQDFVLDTQSQASRSDFLGRIQGETLSGIFVNTGGPKPGDVLALSNQDWRDAFEQLLLGPIHLVRDLVPQVERGGSIVFNASSSVRDPIAHLALSNVLRAGVYALAKTLADELSPDRIRVNVIVPGRIATDRVQQLDEKLAASLGVRAEEVRRQSEEKIPMGRYGQPEEFGRLAAFLLSPQASYLNGQAYWVDGGQSRSL